MFCNIRGFGQERLKLNRKSLKMRFKGSGFADGQSVRKEKQREERKEKERGEKREEQQKCQKKPDAGEPEGP